MRDLFVFIVVIVFFIETVVFTYVSMQNYPITDKYYNEYKNKKLLVVTLAKLAGLSVFLYAIYFPARYTLSMGRPGAYILGSLYCLLSAKFLWNCLLFFKKKKCGENP